MDETNWDNLQPSRVPAKEEILPKSVRQATVYLTSTERADFEFYATQYLLDAAGLIALLFAREMRIGQLCNLISRDIAPDGRRKTKVTAHLKETDHASLAALAMEHDGSVSQIGAVLVRAELRDRWLERACVTRFESHDDE